MLALGVRSMNFLIFDFFGCRFKCITKKFNIIFQLLLNLSCFSNNSIVFFMGILEIVFLIIMSKWEKIMNIQLT